MNKLFAVFIILSLALSGYSQKPAVLAPAAPESAGFSSERLKRIDNAMSEWVEKNWMNGGVALIARDGKIVYHKAVGYNDLSTRQALRKDDIFRIASQTKAITSVAIMMLFDEGKLLLSDPVSKFIPSFKNQVVLDKYNATDTTYTTTPAARPITIKDLLTHTSGVGYAQIGSKEANAIYAKNKLTAGLDVSDESLQTKMERLGTLPLMHQPGQKWTYGLNTDLLGAIVEIVSGMNLDRFFKTRIFEPLGMNDTYFNVPASKAGRLTTMYVEESGKLVKAGNQVFGQQADVNYPLKSTSYFSGGAGLSSTAYDYAVFLQMLLNGGIYNGKRILGKNTVRMMVVNQIGDLSFGDNKFGLGFSIVTEKGSAAVPANIGTYSWGGAFATSYWVDPKEKLVMLFYRQLAGTTHGDVVEKFRALTYQALNE